MTKKKLEKADQKPPASGKLRSQVIMEIQTGLAQRFVHGRERSENVAPIIGVIGFGQRARILWRAASEDDPYADWTLLKIEESIHESKALIDQHASRIQEVLTAMGGFKIEIAQAVSPVEIPLEFSNPYGYMGAYLVADLDVLSCTVLTARRLGLIDQLHSDEILRSAGRAIRRTFNYAVQWRFTGVTRNEVRQMSQTAQRARTLMGEIPLDVLSGEKRARIAPPINQKINQPPSDPKEISNTEKPDEKEIERNDGDEMTHHVRKSAG